MAQGKDGRRQSQSYLAARKREWRWAGRVDFMRGYVYVSFPRPSGCASTPPCVCGGTFLNVAGAAGNGKIEIGNRHLRSSVGVGVGVARASTRALIVGSEKRKEVRIQERQAATGRTYGMAGRGPGLSAPLFPERLNGPRRTDVEELFYVNGYDCGRVRPLRLWRKRSERETAAAAAAGDATS